MKKTIVITLEVESHNENSLTDNFIKHDIEQELNCASNNYELISMTTEQLSNTWRRIHRIAVLRSKPNLK